MPLVSVRVRQGSKPVRSSPPIRGIMAFTTSVAAFMSFTGPSVQVPSTKITRPSRVITLADPPFSRSRSSRVSWTAAGSVSASEDTVPSARINASSTASTRLIFFIRQFSFRLHVAFDHTF